MLIFGGKHWKEMIDWVKKNENIKENEARLKGQEKK